MGMTAELQATQNAGFILQVLNALNSIEKRVKSHKLLLARYFKPLDQPRLEWTTTQMAWEFELGSIYERDALFTTKIELVIDEAEMAMALREGVGSERKGVKSINFGCSCEEWRQDLCPHIATCATFLRQKLSALEPARGIEFLRQMVSDGKVIGERLVASVSKMQEETTAETESSPMRIQWRVSSDRYVIGYGHPFGILAYGQQLRKRGGWSKGRRLKEIFESLDDDAFVHPNDRILATMIELDGGGCISDGVALREALLLLRGHPNVVFDDEFLTPVSVIEQRLELRMDEDGDLYRPTLWLGDHRLDSAQSELLLFESTAKNYLAVVLNRELGTIWFSMMNEKMFLLLKDFRLATRRKAMLDLPMAEKLADLLALPSTKPIQQNLPESLAGPEQPLAPEIEVHLMPSLNAIGMQVALRVACDATEEAPVPGGEPQKLRISTPAGRFQLVRDLVAEVNNAESIALRIGLDGFKPISPYTWYADSDDLALELVERLQKMGEHAPTVCWPKSKPMRLIGEITPQRLQVRVESQRDWFGVDGIASLDGLEIPLAELLAALRTGRRFVPMGDGQFATISDQLRQRLTAIHDASQNETGGIRISRAAIPILEESLGDDISYESDEKWQEALRKMQEIRDYCPAVPEGLQATLREYQKHGFEWLARLSYWGMGGCLADDMGLGKTVQALGVLLERADQGPALIVAPTSVGNNWVRETERFAPSLRAKLYREHDRQHLVETAAPRDLIITSYQMLQRDAERFTSRTWHTMVLDEAQYIKNFQTKTAKAVRDIESNWCLALSGTPLENHLGELWSLMRAVSPGLLGSWERFRKQFAEPIERDRSRERLQALGKVVRPFVLRRTKKEVLTELPPRTEVVRIAELSDEERKKYDAARLAALTELTAGENGENDQQKRIRVLAWLTRLRQLACHPRLVDPRWDLSSAKLDLFKEIVEELREGEHRALVFSQFVQHLTLIREALDKMGIKYRYLDGSTPAAKRQDEVDAFQNGDGDLFLISLKAGGTGLNLTAADYVLHLDPWWNPAVEDQATDRAHRIGQNRAVTVYRLVAKDTIEEQILALHEDKRELISGVLDGADRAGKMSTDELIRLIRLSQVQGSE